MHNSNSISRRYLRWLVFGSSTYCVYACVAEFLAALISSLNWNRNKIGAITHETVIKQAFKVVNGTPSGPDDYGHFHCLIFPFHSDQAV